MAPLAWLIIAHGGLYGIAAESAIVVVVAAFVGWMWLGERAGDGAAGHSTLGCASRQAT